MTGPPVGGLGALPPWPQLAPLALLLVCSSDVVHVNIGAGRLPRDVDAVVVLEHEIASQSLLKNPLILSSL